jgi:hypothetical protein
MCLALTALPNICEKVWQLEFEAWMDDIFIATREPGAVFG